MALDPNISLQVQPPAPTPNLLTQAGQVLSLRDLIQGAPVRQQQQQEALKASQLENQQRAAAVASTQALNDSMRESLTTDPATGMPKFDRDVLQRKLAERGQGSHIPGVLKSFTDADEAAAKLQETKGKVADLEADYMGHGFYGVSQAPPDQQPALLHTFLSHAAATGYQSAAQLDQAVQSDPSKIPVILQQGIAKSPGVQKLLAEKTTADARKTTADTGATKATAELPGIASKSAQDQLVLAGQTLGTVKSAPEWAAKRQFLAKSLTPDVLAQIPEQFSLDAPAAVSALSQTPEQRATLVSQQAARDEAARHNKVDEGLSGARLNLEQNKFNQTLGAGRDANGQPLKDPTTGKPLTGDAYLSALPPGTASQVKAIAEGRQEKPGRGSKDGIALMSMVNQYDPTYTDQRAQIRKSFTTGQTADNIGALNVATVHLDQLTEAADALKNGNWQFGNSVWNRVSNAIGKPAPTNFESLRAAVSSEMAKALKGNATDVEIHNIAQTIDSTGSPDQLAGAIQTSLHTLGAKLNDYQARYSQQIPGDTTWSPVRPAAAAVYQKHGINPAAKPTGSGTDKNPYR